MFKHGTTVDSCLTVLDHTFIPSATSHIEEFGLPHKSPLPRSSQQSYLDTKSSSYPEQQMEANMWCIEFSQNNSIISPLQLQQNKPKFQNQIVSMSKTFFPTNGHTWHLAVIVGPYLCAVISRSSTMRFQTYEIRFK